MKHSMVDGTLQLSHINASISAGAQDYIKACDRSYHAYVRQVANSIAADSDNKVVMLAGPSGSGKTTTAHFCAKYMNDLGIETVSISLDDFYLGRDKVPRLADGRLDYETIDALNIEEMNECIFGLIRNGRCDMPQFDFNTGMPKKEKIHVELKEGGIAIFEGIHALNPRIVRELPQKNLLKVYVSVEDGVYDGDKMLLSPREIRLSRRLIRDSIFRNSGALNTLHMWTGVILGEDKYLNPYKDTADVTINSLHPFEPCIMKNYILSLLEGISPEAENYHIAAEIYDDYTKFNSAEKDYLPANSMIREFVGQ